MIIGLKVIDSFGIVLQFFLTDADSLELLLGWMQLAQQFPEPIRNDLDLR
jgi:hypothetical protein